MRYRAAKASFYLWPMLALIAFFYYCFVTLHPVPSAGWVALLGFVVGTWLLVGSMFFGVLWAIAIQLHAASMDVVRWFAACFRQAVADLPGEDDVLVDVPSLEAQVTSLVSAQVTQWAPYSALVPLVEDWAPRVVAWGLRWLASAVVGQAWVGEPMTIADLEAILRKRIDQTVFSSVRWALRMASLAVFVGATVWLAIPFLLTWLGLRLVGDWVQ